MNQNKRSLYSGIHSNAPIANMHSNMTPTSQFLRGADLNNSSIRFRVQKVTAPEQEYYKFNPAQPYAEELKFTE